MSAEYQEWRDTLSESGAPCHQCHVLIQGQKRGGISLVLRADSPVGHIHDSCVADCQANQPDLAFRSLEEADYPIRSIPEPEEEFVAL